MVAFIFHIHEIGMQSTQSGFLMSFQESCIVCIKLICRKYTGMAEVD